MISIKYCPNNKEYLDIKKYCNVKPLFSPMGVQNAGLLSIKSWNLTSQ